MLVSVITPFYKGNTFIRKLSETIYSNVKNLSLNERDIDVDWIIVNDSPDIKVDTSDIPSKLQYKIINHERNSGIHQARVTGINNTNADYVLLLDQDDLIDNKFLLRQIENIGNADVSVCNGYDQYPTGEKRQFYKTYAALREISDLKAYLCITNFIRSPGQCLIRRKSIPEQWLKNIMNNNGSDDLLLWIMMLADNKKFVTCKDCLYIHRFTGNNVSASESTIENSSFEVEKVLKNTHALNDKQLDQLHRSIEWSVKSSKDKIKCIFSNTDLIGTRIYWKARKSLSKKI